MSSLSSTAGSPGGGAVDWDGKKTFFNLFRFEPAMVSKVDYCSCCAAVPRQKKNNLSIFVDLTYFTII